MSIKGILCYCTSSVIRNWLTAFCHLWDSLHIQGFIKCCCWMKSEFFCMECLTQHNFEIQKSTSLTISMIGLNSCAMWYFTVPSDKDTCIFSNKSFMNKVKILKSAYFVIVVSLLKVYQQAIKHLFVVCFMCMECWLHDPESLQKRWCLKPSVKWFSTNI